MLVLPAIAASPQASPKAPAPASFEALARQAAAARDQDRLDEAVRLYRQALRIKPAWADGWWSLGTIWYDSDRYTDCASAFNRFVALKADAGPAHALLGLCQFGLKDYDSALRHLFRAEELGFLGNAQIREVSLYHAALALILRQGYEKALEQIALLLQSVPASDAIRTAAGLAALRKPLLPDQVPEKDRDLVSQVGNAVAAQLERRPEDAARAFDAILAAYPMTPEVHYAYGALLIASDPPKGLAMLRQELDINPAHVPALASIALEYLKENDAESAKPYAAKAARLAPADFAARTANGRVLLELGQAPEAIRELEVAVRLAPDSPHARFALATAYARAGRSAEADRERKEFARLTKLSESGKK